MKRILVATVIGLTLAIGGVQSAEAGYSRPKQCWNDWAATSKLRAPNGTTCATARNVLDTWMMSDGYLDKDYIRVGRDGVLWRCNGYRDYGKLNPWHIYCFSSQKKWHYNAEYDYSYYTTKSMWFNYRD